MNDQTQGGSDVSDLDRSFAAAMAAAERAPESAEAWDHLEELAEKLNRADEVAGLYRGLIERELAPHLLATVGQRGVQFHEAWFGDTPERITDLLGRITEVDADAAWAFERLTVMLTSAGRWDDLLAAYDGAIDKARDPARKRQLLDDAAQAAKDFADQPDRAADYLRQLVELDPDNPALLGSLERLLERGRRFRDLVALWEGQLASEDASARRHTRMRIARCWLEELGEPQRSVDVLRDLLTESPGQVEACGLLEAVLDREEADLGTRRQALSLLRKHYLVADRPEDVVRVLEAAVRFVEAEERRPIHRELATRLAIVGRDEAAMAQYRALLLEDPSDADARKQLRQLAGRSGRHDLHAEALVAAAEACIDPARRAAVLLDAAHVHQSDLGDATGAIALFRRVLEAEEAEAGAALSAAHALDELLEHEDLRVERLAVLEKLATLERSSSVRRSVLAEAARIAEALGDDARALASWQPVLARDPRDLEALDAVVTLLARGGRFEELAEILARRAEAAPLPLQRRADRVELAKLQAGQLGRPEDAIASWLEIRREFGPAPDVTEALDDLLTAAGRHDDLAEALLEAAGSARAADVALFRRLGELYLGPLERPREALPWLSAALAVAPADAPARAAMRKLLDEPATARSAAESLARAYEVTDDAEALVEVLEQRLASARDRGEQAALLRQAARLHLDRDDAASALGCFCRALPLEPESLATEAEMMRLAERTERWTTVAASLRMAAQAASEAPRRAAELRRAEGATLEHRLADSAAGLEAYRAAVTLNADDSEAIDAIVRCAAQARAWDTATQAAVEAVALRDRVRPETVGALEAGARDTDDWASLASSLGLALGDRRLGSAASQTLEIVVARWFRTRVGDVEAATRAAERAARLGGPGRLEALTLLSELQRERGGEGLLPTLLELDRLNDDTLDFLDEAASIAEGEGAPVLERLYRKAAGMWLRGETASGRTKAPAAARSALDRLLAEVAHNPERAIEVLLDATRLPLDADETVALRRRAAELLVEHGQRGRAIDVYRGVVEQRPRDIEVVDRMASLCEEEGRLAEALALRLREIDLVEDPERRLLLRLDHARLTGGLEAQGGRVASLRANLADQPGHEASIEELAKVLEERGKHIELATILSEQASELETRGERARAASLFSRVAALAEGPLGERARAIEAHGRVVELDARVESFDALARLHLDGGEPGEAARWLERRLELTAASERVSVLLRLARARIRSGERDAAIGSLRSAFEEAPRNAEVRKLLLDLYRQGREHEALADLLTRAALAVTDERTVLAYAREAATIYRDRLDAPARAVPVLEKAVELAPDDRELELALAEGLRAAGDLEGARSLLEKLVESFGRRRSHERARTHLELARVLNAQGDDRRAIDELEVASSMAPGDVSILVTLAELASESGELDRAERAYRTLLVSARREAGLVVGPAEILFQLSHLAAARGQEDKARELVESGLEALAQRDDEAPRVLDKLRRHGNTALLERVLGHRLGYVTAPHKRAQIQAEIAELYRGLGREGEALAARLAAVETDPSSPLHHQEAWDAASAAGNLDAYVSVVEALLADERADRNAHVRCELLLRLGEVLEKERGDVDRAAALYAQAESTGVRTVDVLRARARVAGQRGDGAVQMRLLEQLANLGEAEAETRSDALYRLAEVQLATSDTLAEGLAALEKALADDFRAERAALVLRRAAEEHATDLALLDLYEQVARRSGDEDTLLHYLIRRAESATATAEQVREAVETARRLERLDEAEALMLRAAEIGKTGSRDGDLAAVDWALLGLAERRMAHGDLPGAVRWLVEAADVADLEEVFVLAGQLADLAASGDLTLAAKLYERLLERAPTDRRAWQPLAEICGRLGDVDRLERIVEETLDGLSDSEERHALRVALARAMLAHESRQDDAVSVLEQILAEDSAAVEAERLLVSHLEKKVDEEALVDLLGRQLDRAVERGDGLSVTRLALDLAERLDDEASLAVLRRALDVSPEEPRLLESLLSRLGPEPELRLERAQLLETLIRVADATSAGSRALELSSLYRDLEDEEAAVRALEVGLERAPGDETLRGALLASYRERGDHAGLARVLVATAERTEETRGRAALLREAAAVRRDELGDPSGAADLLRQASELAPDDRALRIELARALGAAGDHDSAVEVVTSALETAADPVDLLRVRAELELAGGRDEAALDDLERAYAITPDAVAAALEAVLLRRLDQAGGDEERGLTLRAVEVMLARGERQRGSELLSAYAHRTRGDVEVLRRLRDLDTADGRWRSVAETCARLIHLEEGAAKIDAALGLSHACHELGEPEEAREGLEHVRRTQGAPQVRSELRRIYAKMGDQRELARLLVEDAADLKDPSERAELLGHAGRILLDLGAVSEAVPPLEEALSLVAGQPEAVVTLADAYLAAERLDDAERLLDEAVAAGRGRRTPEMALYHHRKATIAGSRGDLTAQLELLQEAHACNKKYGAAAAALADLAEELGDLELAAKTLRTITLIDTECPIGRGEAFLRQGRIALRQNDDKNARMWARRAKREDPDDPEIDAFLAALGGGRG